MNRDDRTRLRALADAATAPEWRWSAGVGDIKGGEGLKTFIASGVWPHDAELICAARTAIPALLDALEVSESERGALADQAKDRDARIARLEALLMECRKIVTRCQPLFVGWTSADLELRIDVALKEKP